MGILDIGVSGLLSNQAALRTAGNNVANAGTEGYSRQNVIQTSNTTQFTGVGYLGTGVQVDSIQRTVDGFVIDQLRQDTTVFNQVDSYLSNISQIDGLLADATTGLAPGLQEFFAALNEGANDPTSLPVRQLVITEADGLVSQFDRIQQQLDGQNLSINQQLDALSEQVSALAQSLAALNDGIAAASSRGAASPPNDLLDERDQRLKELAELVSVSVVKRDLNTVDVFIGNGQPLVVGTRANQIVAIAGDPDPLRDGLAIISNGITQPITDLVTGGKIGGLLEYRNDVLDKAYNAIGRVALVLAENINEQHVKGLDLEGNFGTNFFSDINNLTVAQSRVVADTNNVGAGIALDVTIEDSSLLTTTDYIFEYTGPTNLDYRVRRVDNDAIVGQGTLTGVAPESIVVDGFSINISAGAGVAGDEFLVMPTRRAGEQIAVEIDQPGRLALAAAVAGQIRIGSQGSGSIEDISVFDVTTAAFAVPGELSPPLLVQFTSATTYDILDNTNPARPVPLDPPLINLSFTPGINNSMLPTEGQTAISSTGADAGSVLGSVNTVPPDASPANAYPGEDVTILRTNPDTGITTADPLFSIAAGQSALAVAQQLNGVPGLSATARTQISLSGFTSEAVNVIDQTITVNGLTINAPGDLAEPSPLEPNYLADRINADPAFAAAGIRARSDGQTLILESLSGGDLNIGVGGDAGDAVTLTDINGGSVLLQGAGVVSTENQVTIGGTVTVILEDNTALTSSAGGLFAVAPVGTEIYQGYQLTMDGNPQAGDMVTLDFNEGGVSDNRNGLAMTAFEYDRLIGDGASTMLSAYGQLVAEIGTSTARAQINAEAAQSLLQQSQDRRDSISAVSLDEEAANLIRFEQAYNASAQVISIARSLFDTLINAFR